MNICVGIISYFPDNEIRDHRMSTCMNVLKKIDDILSLPIIIVAQNWKDSENVIINDLENNVYLYKYNKKLGITGARRKLRKIFLESGFDYMIMLDDDSYLSGSRRDGELYIKQIENNPNKWGAYKDSLLKLFAISKEMFKLIDYPEGEAEHGDFFEDMYLIKALRKKHSDKEFRFIHNGLREISDSAYDKNSTWFHRQFNKHDIGDRTRAMIARL